MGRDKPKVNGLTLEEIERRSEEETEAFEDSLILVGISWEAHSVPSTSKYK